MFWIMTRKQADKEKRGAIEQLEDDLSAAKMKLDWSERVQAETERSNEIIAGKLSDCQKSLDAAKVRIDELEHQNAILRQYYRLDGEVSDEDRDKILLDLKYREMEKELLELKSKNLIYETAERAILNNRQMWLEAYSAQQNLSSQWCLPYSYSYSIR